MSKSVKNKYAKRLKPKPFKLEYLREVEKNLVLHCIQPEDTPENLKKYNSFHAPPGLIRRMLIVLDDLTRRFKRNLKIRIRVDKALEGKDGLEREMLEGALMLKELSEIGSHRKIPGLKINRKEFSQLAATFKGISARLGKKERKEKS